MDYLVQTEDANGTDISVTDINGSQLDIDHLLSTANTSGNSALCLLSIKLVRKFEKF